MTVSRASTKLSLALTTLALVAVTGCADVGGSTPLADEEFPVPKSTDQNVIICESIKQAMKKDKKAAEEAKAAGNEREAAGKLEAVQAGANGAATVPGCDVSDIFTASSSASPVASPS